MTEIVTTRSSVWVTPAFEMGEDWGRPSDGEASEWIGRQPQLSNWLRALRAATTQEKEGMAERNGGFFERPSRYAPSCRTVFLDHALVLDRKVDKLSSAIPMLLALFINLKGIPCAGASLLGIRSAWTKKGPKACLVTISKGFEEALDALLGPRNVREACAVPPVERFIVGFGGWTGDFAGRLKETLAATPGTDANRSRRCRWKRRRSHRTTPGWGMCSRVAASSLGLL
jgi:hypothetical protein